MAKRRGSKKGTPFEREICVALSLWYSKGKRDDVFWRSTTSGARATTRRKSGKQTSGQSGDICAIHPRGKTLTDLMPLELKRGYNGDTLHEFIDRPPHLKPAGWEAFIAKAIAAAENERAPYWGVIAKRDQRESIIVFPHDLRKDLVRAGSFSGGNGYAPGYIAGRVSIRDASRAVVFTGVIYGMQLADFMRGVDPDSFQWLADERKNKRQTG